MQRLPLYAASVLAAASLTLGCGSDSDEDRGAAPEISALTFSPDTIPVGMQSTISGTFTFSDPDADVQNLHILVTLPSGQKQELPGGPVSGASGHTSAAANFALFLAPPEAGAHGFELWVTDAKKNESNRLIGTITAQ